MKRGRDILKTVQDAITAHAMVLPGERVLVAVSGGADSICLLDILYTLRRHLDIHLAVAHFNHGLRPGEDETETAFVAGLAASMGLPCECGSPVQPLAPGPGSLEERARSARYAFLEEARVRLRAQKIALAHQMNDQAETFLLRLLRGSGSEGLGGIPPVREGRLIRPLLGVSRPDIEAHLRRRGLAFITDPSNLSLAHLRNRVRLELMPLLGSYQPRVVERLAETAALLRQDQSFLKECALAWLSEHAWAGPGWVKIPRTAFCALPAGLRNHVVREAMRNIGGDLRRVQSRHIEAVNRIGVIPGNHGPLRLPKKILVHTQNDRLIVHSGPPANPPRDFSFEVDGPGVFMLDEARATLTLRLVGTGAVAGNPYGVEYFDAGTLDFPLTVRNPRPGDRFRPLGMCGTKKLKDFFIDLKIPREQRPHTVLVTHRDDSEIVWVCGLRIGDRFKVTSETKNVLEGVYSRWSNGGEG